MLGINISTLVLLVTIPFLIYLYIKRRQNYWKERGVPYVSPVFLVGSLFDVLRGKVQVAEYLGHLHAQFKGPYFGMYVMGNPHLVVRSPEIIKDMLIRDFNYFEDRSFASDKFSDPISGNSLFMMKNPRWKALRGKLLPIHSTGKLKTMFSLMVKSAEDLENYLEKHKGEDVEVREISANFMTDLISSCAFGFEANSFGEVESDVRKFSRTILDFTVGKLFCFLSHFFFPKFATWFNLKFLDTSALEKVFLSTLKHREDAKMKRNDFVDLLLKVRDENNDKISFDIDTMLSQSLTFFIAGVETTSNVVAFLLYNLCLHQDVQNRLREEINETIKSEDDFTFENIQGMKYLDMVVTETLRKYPFGLFLNRICKSDYVIRQTGFKIEKGTPIIISIAGVHADPDNYINPELFNPERFREGVKTFANECKYLPFGTGPRNCIGSRFSMIGTKLAVVVFLRYKLEQCDETPTEIKIKPFSPFMTPKNGLTMHISKV